MEISQYSPLESATVSVTGETSCHLMVCLCGLTAEDMVSHLAGLPVSHCARHAAVKLESLANLRTVVWFASVDADGNFRAKTLDEVKGSM